MAIWMAVALAAAVFPPEDGDGLPRSLQVDPEFKTVDLILDLVKRADGKAAMVDLDTIAARASKG